MNVTVSLERGMHAWHATSGSGRERAFRVASRHSRLVRRLRMAIPIGVGGVLAFYVLASFFNPFNALSRLPSSIKLQHLGHEDHDGSAETCRVHPRRPFL